MLWREKRGYQNVFFVYKYLFKYAQKKNNFWKLWFLSDFYETMRIYDLFKMSYFSHKMRL